MTPEERQMLTDLANKIAQTPAPQRDAEAEDFIHTRIGSRPDALYILTQTVLVQNMAVDHAQQEIAQLKQQLAHASAPPPSQQGGGSFLGRGSGWGSPAAPPPQQQQWGAPAQPQAVQPPYGQPGYPPPTYGPGPAAQPSQSGMGSFLRSAGTTAAGVAAGALAFEGIKSLFGGVEHVMGFGNQPHMGGSGFLNDRPVEETVINNYYEGDRPNDDRDRDRFDDRRSNFSGSDVADIGPDDSVQYDNTDVPADDFDDSQDDDSQDDDQS